MKNLTTVHKFSVFAVVGILAFGFAVGYYAGGFGKSINEVPQLSALDSAHGGKFMSMSTGWINEDVEGLFVLDHLTGTLYCWILNARTGALAASYETNVRADLGAGEGKDSDLDYVMVTGAMRFSGGYSGGNLRPANTVVYVGEGNSGKVAGYSFLYSRANSGGIPQSGRLERIAIGQTRAGILQRDQ